MVPGAMDRTDIGFDLVELTDLTAQTIVGTAWALELDTGCISASPLGFMTSSMFLTSRSLCFLIFRSNKVTSTLEALMRIKRDCV